MHAILERVDLTHVATSLVEFIPNLIAAILVFAAFMGFYVATRRALEAALRRAGIHAKLIELVVKGLFKYVLVAFGAIMAADQLGINVGAAVAGLGVAGIAIGFAAQDSVANSISGFLIFWDKPFVVGDWITTETQYGQVVDITMRSTRIRTNRNTFVVIPNKTIINSVLENHSKQGELRMEVPVGIAYKEQIAEARKVLIEAVEKLEWVRRDPPPDVVAEELGSSSVNLRLRAWIDDAQDMQKTQYALVETAKVALDGAGIQIPFPHLQLFVDKVEDRVWEGATVQVRS
jgi:small conductance mechanosensitive channel